MNFHFYDQASLFALLSQVNSWIVLSTWTGEPPDESPIKRAQRRVVPNTDDGATRVKGRAGASFSTTSRSICVQVVISMAI
eukprot:XP_001706102.1 Hypothetical protein GL50803_90329 [Giardia lamblia ATCC 50803]